MVTKKRDFQYRKILMFDSNSTELQVLSGLDSEVPEKVMCGKLKKYIGEVFRGLALYKEFKRSSSVRPRSHAAFISL